MIDPTGEIDARPSKSLFVDMLTRDIGVIECMLDLVDNAVDKAVELSGFDAMHLLLDGPGAVWPAGRRIDIRLSATSFEIKDTCGGISLQEAKTRVFLFGDPHEREAGTGLSVFGIGLKRAVFKLGRQVDVASVTEREHFSVHIDVDAWNNDENNWSFDFASEGQNQELTPPLRRGTSIRVHQLSEAARTRLADPRFEVDLTDKLSATYALFLMAGLELTVNGAAVTATLPQFASETISTARRQVEWKGVDILIVAGVAPPGDVSAHGWYVFCNGRMVVEADRSEVTGWGTNLPQFHVGKYRRFVGYVYFRSQDVRLLPWRTTKQGVDTEAEVYRAAMLEMRLQGRAIVSFLNDLYPSDVQADILLERSLLTRAGTIGIDRLPMQDAAFQVRRESVPLNPTVSIQYRRSKADVARVARHLGDATLSAGKVGERTFDYYVEQELD